MNPSDVRHPRVSYGPLLVLGTALIVALVGLGAFALNALNRSYVDVTILAFDPVSGDTAWELNDRANATPLIGQSVIVTETGAGVVAYDPSGALVWSVKDGRVKHVSVDHGTVYITSEDGDGQSMLLVVDEATGEQLWQMADASPRELGAKLVLVAGDYGYRFLNASTGEVLAEFHGQVRNTAIAGAYAVGVVGRDLIRVGVDSGATTIARLDNRQELIAVFADTAILQHRGPKTTDGPRAMVLTAADIVTGDARWELSVDRFQRSQRHGNTLWLIRDHEYTTIDIETGTESSPAAVPPRTPTTILGPAGATVRLELLDYLGSSETVEYYRAGTWGNRLEPRVVRAVDASDGTVLWERTDVQYLAASDSVVVLDDRQSQLIVVGAASGQELATIPRVKRIDAAASGDIALIASGGNVWRVSPDGLLRTVVEAEDHRIRVTAYTDDIVVVDHPADTGDGGFRRVVAAYDMATGEHLWRKSLSGFRSGEIIDSTLILVQGRKVVEIDLGSGSIVRDAERTVPIDEGESRQRVVAVFDPDMARLLWSTALTAPLTDYGVVGETVVVVGATFDDVYR